MSSSKELKWVYTTPILILGPLMFGSVLALLLLILILYNDIVNIIVFTFFFIISLYVFIDSIKFVIIFRGGKRNISYYNYKICQSLKNKGILNQLNSAYKKIKEIRYLGLFSIFYKTHYYVIEDNPKKRLLLLIDNYRTIVFLTASCIEEITIFEQILHAIKE